MHEETSHEFKGQFKAGHYCITDFETFQWKQLKFCKKTLCYEKK